MLNIAITIHAIIIYYTPTSIVLTFITITMILLIHLNNWTFYYSESHFSSCYGWEYVLYSDLYIYISNFVKALPINYKLTI